MTMSVGNSKGGSRVFENEMRNILLYNIILHYFMDSSIRRLEEGQVHA